MMKVNMEDLQQKAEQAVRWMRSCLEEPEAAGKYRKLDCEYCPFGKSEGYCVDNMHIEVAALLEKLLAGGGDKDAGSEWQQSAGGKEKNPPVSPLGKGTSVGTDSSSPLAPPDDMAMGEEISAMDYLRSIGAIKDDGK